MASRARAYAEQARADYDAYLASGEGIEPGIGEHHRLQLLQMASEELAKAFLYHAEPNARYSHHVALAAINRVRAHAVAEAVGMTLATFSQPLDAAKPNFLQIEAASPSAGPDGKGLTREESERTASVEYPWQSNVNDPASWMAPVSHSFAIVHALRYDPRSVTTVRLLGRLIEAANTVLPNA